MGRYIGMLSNGIIHMLIEYLIFLILPILAVDIIIGVVVFMIYSEKGHRRWIIGYLLLLLLQLFIAQRFFFPTYWKYPDPLIDSDIVRYTDVEELYGPFDIDELRYKAYYIYTDNNKNIHYYILEIDSDGFISVIYEDIL